MTLVSLTHCSHLLGLDPKTLRRWMSLSGICAQPHPTDARLKCLTPEQVQQLAQAHRRTLADEVQPAISAPTTASRLLSPLVVSDVLLDEGALLSSSLTKQLGSLQAHVAALQSQLTVLNAQLQKQGKACTPEEKSLQPSWEISLGSSLEMSLQPSVEKSLQPSLEMSPKSPKDNAATSALPRPRGRHAVLPRVEYCTDARYIVICPTRGLLTFEPDSPEWFAWLSTLSSFRFLGASGHLTVHRNQCAPQWTWRGTRSIHSRSRSLSLVRTPFLTTAVLELAAASLQSLLN